MAIVNKTIDYTGRKLDISVFQSTFDLGVALPVTIAFGSPSKFCAGIQKLVQRYAILLMTDLGSQSFYPDSGVNFLGVLQSGVNPVDKIAVSQLFTLASYNVLSKLKTYQNANPTIPEDEQISNATLVNLVLSGGTVSFDVKITSMAGDSANLLLPLPK